MRFRDSGALRNRRSGGRAGMLCSRGLLRLSKAVTALWIVLRPLRLLGLRWVVVTEVASTIRTSRLGLTGHSGLMVANDLRWSGGRLIRRLRRDVMTARGISSLRIVARTR